MISNEGIGISVNNLKCKIIFLINGMNHTTDKRAIPKDYKSELRKLKLRLQEYVSQKEYNEFFSEILEIPLQSVVEEAEEIIKERGQNDGR
ncbi:hypothetical protein ES695_14335 [Candidatus Atribacteria bacterium 1244-E10-H5-B2]|nr:MAG: hypothetical protein ES695_14335 [Candidatus Atribacteria bacterium 1244-E10-H5-B2]